MEWLAESGQILLKPFGDSDDVNFEGTISFLLIKAMPWLSDCYRCRDNVDLSSSEQILNRQIRNCGYLSITEKRGEIERHCGTK